MKVFKTISVLLVVVICFALKTNAQINPNNIPKPPTAELEKHKPFFGKWKISSIYAGLNFSGTLEIKSAIKGWYIERTILVKSSDGKIDREYRSMVTYDSTVGHYRIWRFETMPPGKIIEGKGRFEGSTFIEEWEFRPGNVFRNRHILVNKNEMRIETESENANGEIRHIGVTPGKRVIK